MRRYVMPEDIERWDPFREMMTLRNRVDHLFESMFARPRGAWMATSVEYPTLDMYESDGKIKIDVPLPGVKPEEVELTTSGNTLTIKGEHKAKEEVKEADYYRHEMHYGVFTRAVTLPETVDVKHPEAVFENGVLTVSFPKLTTAEPKRIEIKAKELKAKHVG
jgi:HSP20 family protein